MSSSGLTAASLDSAGSFNWIFLVSIVVVGILGLFFLFYFNRLFATVVSYAIRLYTWHTYKIYIDIEALQISLLAGRVFFKGIRYHGDNLTVFVHGGFITWRYWLRTVKDTAAFVQPAPSNIPEAPSKEVDPNTATTSAESDATHSKKLRCRVSVEISGFEAILYNNSLAYTNIVNGINKKGPNAASDAQSNFARDVEKFGYQEANAVGTHDARRSSERLSPVDDFERDQTTSSLRTNDLQSSTGRKISTPPSLSQRARSTSGDASPNTASSTPSFPAFLRILPVHVKCNTGGLVLGNEHTRSVITVKFDSAEGELDADRAGPLDIFRLLTNFDLEHPIIHLRPNTDYKGAQLSEAANLKSSTAFTDEAPKRSPNTAATGFWHDLRRSVRGYKFPLLRMLPLRRRGSKDSVFVGHGEKYLPANQDDLPGHGRWLGLSRYLDDTQHDEHDEWNAVEYAKSSTLADISGVHLKFVMDMPGPVLSTHPSDEPSHPTLNNDINGGTPPEYSLDLVVHGGQLTYGPWADRHRVNLQQIFFPTPYTDAIRSVTLKAGETRVATVFKINVDIDGETTLRIPFRETSKDWRWKGRAPAPGTSAEKPDHNGKVHGKHKGKKAKSRPQSGKSTDIRPFGWFDMTVFPSSSVKYTMAMVAGPSGFNNKLELNVNSLSVSSSLNHDILLRSHKVELRSDLSNPLAWNGLRSWPFDILLTKLECFLLRDHTFMLVDLIADWGAGPLPEFFTFAPYRYSLGIKIVDLQLYLNTNDANIVNNPDDMDDNNFVMLQSRKINADLVIPLDRFRPSQSEITFDVVARDLALRLCMPPINTINVLLAEKEVARLDSVFLSGVYSLCSEVAPGLTETLNMDMTGNNLTLYLYGFVARQLIRIKENYFGDDIHFRTLEEYRESIAKGHISNAQPPAKANDLDVILNIKAQDVNIILPAGLYNADNHIRAHLEVADVDLRVTNYYLEMMVNSSPLELSYTQWCGEDIGCKGSGVQVILDGAKVFGHRLFGLPPAEPPYADDWEVDAGALTGECTVEFLRILAQASQAIALTIDDNENAMSIPQTVVWHQATFAQFQCPLVRIACVVEREVFLLTVEDIQGSFSDWAGQLFSQRLRMEVPKLSLICLDRELALQCGVSGTQKIAPLAQFDTALSLNMVQRSVHFDDERMLQQEHIRKQDVRASRAQFLLRSHIQTRPVFGSMDNSAYDPPSIPVPSFPVPLLPDDEQSSTGTQKISSRTTSDDRSSVSSRSSHSGASISASLRMNGPGPSPLRFETHSTNSMEGKALFDWKKTDDIPVTPYLSGDSRKLRTRPSAKTFSSPYKLPIFPLTEVVVDRSELPAYSECNLPSQPVTPVTPSLSAMQDDTVHTSIIFVVEPGIVGYVKPEAVRALACLIQAFNPATPGAMLDDFHLTTIGEVLARNSRRHGRSSILELNAKIPFAHIRFINPVDFVSMEQANSAGSDRYGCVVSELGCAVRIASLSENKKGKDTISLHGTMKSLRLSAEEGTTIARDQGVALGLAIDDVLVWMVDSDRTSIQASFKTAEAVMASRKVDYIAALIHRTTVLMDDFGTRFSSIAPDREVRLRFLIYKLTTLGVEMRDPSYLTRPSQALRSAKDHLRNNDSWKIISKYHYIYQSLSREQRSILLKECASSEIKCPDDAEAHVLEILDESRTWEAMRVKDSFAMRILYGSSEGIEQLHDRSNIPISVIIRAAGINLIVDPGDKQSQFSLDGLTVGLTIIPAPPPSQLLVFDRYNETRDTVLQFATTKLDLRLTWEIFEIVDQVLTLFENNAPVSINDTVVEVPANTSEIVVERVHIVFASRFSSIQLKTINLSQTFASTGLQLSIGGSGWAPHDTNTTINALISADSGSAEMHGLDRLVWRSSVRNPSIWVHYDRRNTTDNVSESVKIIGDSKEVYFGLHDNILGILEVVNSVLASEAKYFKDLFKKHEIIQNSPSNKARPQGMHKSLDITVALFLDVYKFSFKIIPGVTYSTTGRTARISVSPAGEDIIKVDFDLKSQTHRVLYGHSRRSQVASTFDLPAINGAVRLRNKPDLIDADVTMIVEHISLDGRAVYELLTVLGDKFITDGIDAIKSEGLAIKEILDKEFMQPSSAPVNTEGKVILFDVNAVLAGFAITADMPAKENVTSPATFAFDLSSTQIRMSNRTSRVGAALPFPQIRVAFNEIRAEVRQLNMDQSVPCGRLTLGANFRCAVSQLNENQTKRDFALTITGPYVDLNAETAPTIAELMVHLQDRVSMLDLSKEKKYLEKLHRRDRKGTYQKSLIHSADTTEVSENELSSEGPFTSTFAFDMQSTQLSYIVGDSMNIESSRKREDLVFTIKRMHLMTRSEAVARLGVESIQLQFVPVGESKTERSPNSALLPEVIVNVTHAATRTGRKIVLQAAGKALDITLNPQFILPANDLERSITNCTERLHVAAIGLHRKSSVTMTTSTGPSTPVANKGPLTNIKVSSLKLNADFAGAVVRLQGSNKIEAKKSPFSALHPDRAMEHGRYGQFDNDGSASTAVLRAPGIAIKAQYLERLVDDASLNVEVRINASNNILYPTVVPLILQISDSVKEVMSRPKKEVPDLVKAKIAEQDSSVKAPDEGALSRANPQALLGKTKLNFGFRICKQELGLSCQPITKVAASAKLEDIYITVNTVESSENGNFFAASIAFRGLGASLQHVYSREPTFNVHIDSIILSIMNSKHLSGTPGISAILNLNPTKIQINAKQLQELLLFREIWIPPEIRHAHREFTSTELDTEPQEYFVQRYRQVAAQTAFPWNASVAVSDLSIELDLGQTIGKTSFRIANFWVSSKKSSSAKQTLCIGIDDMGINSTGRMSGFVELQRFKVRTSIAWPSTEELERQTPLVQGSIGFQRLRVKAAFDYTAFAVMDVKAFEYIMYNVRDTRNASADRLVAILDGDAVNIYCTAVSAALGVALFQAFERLAQEKEANYEQALREIERFLRRKSIAPTVRPDADSSARKNPEHNKEEARVPLSLHTDVVVTLRSLDVGAFPSTLLDHQILRAEASDVQARFAVTTDEELRLHSGLGLTLGQVQASLASVLHPSVPKTLGETTIEDVVRNAKSARGGVILRVPRVVAMMQTWQKSQSRNVEYIFKSIFEGKIDVGWNYSRISSIRGMWTTHANALASRLGKPLPGSTVKISGAVAKGTIRVEGNLPDEGADQEKITAVVNLPQSRYTYTALEPPIIDTPQLRDMGEATPPLEWVGLHRDKLPNVTHQIVIVTLLEVAREVEDVYSRILGSA